MNSKIKNTLAIVNRQLSIGMLFTATLLASCQKSDLIEVENAGAQPVTINLVADDAVGTRAAATGIEQYVIEVYSDDTYTTPSNIFGEGASATNQATSTDGTFSLVLDRTAEYYCLFWADKDAEAYNTQSLKAVTIVSGKTAAEAWYGTKTISAKESALTVTLKRAVAKINLMETGKLDAGKTLTATFNEPTIFNVADATANTNLSRTETITIAQAIDGSTTPVRINPTDIFTLAPVATKYVAKVTFKYGDEDEFDVDNVPFKANFATNIKGHYTSVALETFTVSYNDEWATPDNGENFSKSLYSIGDYYPEPTDPGTAIGVVFWLDNTADGYVAENGTNPAKGYKGKIMSLDEINDKCWSTESVDITGANSSTDGRANTDAIMSTPNYSAETYPAVAWCVAKNTPAVDGIYWYLPVADEIIRVYDNRAKVNNALVKANGKEFLYYYTFWTSDNVDSDNAVFFTSICEFPS